MSKVEFTEQYLFEKYKETPLNSCKQFKEKIKDYKEIDAYKIYRMILNYQIKRYGIALKDRNCSIPLKTLRTNYSSRKKYRNNKLGKNFKLERWIEI